MLSYAGIFWVDDTRPAFSASSFSQLCLEELFPLDDCDVFPLFPCYISLIGISIPAMETIQPSLSHWKPCFQSPPPPIETIDLKNLLFTPSCYSYTLNHLVHWNCYPHVLPKLDWGFHFIYFSSERSRNGGVDHIGHLFRRLDSVSCSARKLDWVFFFFFGERFGVLVLRLD